MDRFKNNIENALFSNRRGNNSSNFDSKPNIFSNLSFEGDYITYLSWILLFIIVIIVCYLTVMTAKYLSTDCKNKRSWFNYIFRFCYNEVCIVQKTPIAPVINNVHMKYGVICAHF